MATRTTAKVERPLPQPQPRPDRAGVAPSPTRRNLKRTRRISGRSRCSPRCGRLRRRRRPQPFGRRQRQRQQPSPRHDQARLTSARIRPCTLAPLHPPAPPPRPSSCSTTTTTCSDLTRGPTTAAVNNGRSRLSSAVHAAARASHSRSPAGAVARPSRVQRERGRERQQHLDRPLHVAGLLQRVSVAVARVGGPTSRGRRGGGGGVGRVGGRARQDAAEGLLQAARGVGRAHLRLGERHRQGGRGHLHLVRERGGLA